MSKKVLLAWSGGKDSAMALYEIIKNKKYEIVALITTVTKNYDRISMHGVRNALLDKQVEALGLSLERIHITKDSSQQDYDTKMAELLTRHKKKGVSAVVFGDIFLEDLRKYREQNLSKVNMKAIFPIWKRNTRELAKKFIDLGFKAVITCVDSKILDKRFTGKDFDKRFLSELPAGIDPCGENGEFHSFVYNGPVFKKRIAITRGKIVLRDKRFYFCDLLKP